MTERFFPLCNRWGKPTAIHYCTIYNQSELEAGTIKRILTAQHKDDFSEVLNVPKMRCFKPREQIDLPSACINCKNLVRENS